MDPDKAILEIAILKYVSDKGGHLFYRNNIDLAKSHVNSRGYAILKHKIKASVLAKYHISELEIPAEIKQARGVDVKGADSSYTLYKRLLIAVAVGVGVVLASFNLFIDHDQKYAKELISNSLIDPRSAIFSGYKRSGDRACITVNAKNNLGGYVGRKTYILMYLIKELRPTDNPWHNQGEVSGESDCSALLD